MYKVGDKVRILHTDYQGEGFDVGTVHEVYDCDDYSVEIKIAGGTVLFWNKEVEPYTETEPQPAADHWKDIADVLRAGIKLALETADYDRAIDLGWKLDSLPRQ